MMDFKVKKFYSWLLITCTLITTVISFEFPGAINDDECVLFDQNGEKLSSTTWRRGITLPQIEDTAKKSKQLITMKKENLEVKSIFINEKDNKDKYYIDEVRSWDNFTLQTYNFDQYEEYETEVNMTIRVVFYCHAYSQREITFRLPINDTNNHDPKFLKDSYNYTLAMPLTTGFELSPHDPIIVRDVDLTNDKITFDFKKQPKAQGFSVSFLKKDPMDPKNHLAKLIISDTVYLENDVSFTLYATDAGTPPRTTNTTINIKVDAANSLPRFSHSLYTADLTLFYNRKKSRIPLRFTPGSIKLTHGYAGKHKFELNGIADDYKKHFKIFETNKTCGIGKCIDIELIDLPTDFWDHQQDFFVFLKAIKDSFEATTVLYIQVPGKVNTVLVSEVHVDVTNKTIGAVLSFIAIFCLCYVAYIFLVRKKSISYQVNKHQFQQQQQQHQQNNYPTEKV